MIYRSVFDEFTLVQYVGGMSLALALFLFKGSENRKWDFFNWSIGQFFSRNSGSNQRALYSKNQKGS